MLPWRGTGGLRWCPDPLQLAQGGQDLVLVFFLPLEPLDISSGHRLLFLRDRLSSQTIRQGRRNSVIQLNKRSFLRTHSRNPKQMGIHLTRAPAWSPLFTSTGVWQSSLVFGRHNVHIEDSKGKPEMRWYYSHLLVTPSVGEPFSGVMESCDVGDHLWWGWG